MRRKHSALPGIALFLLAAISLGAAISDQQRAQIDQATGAKGSYTADEDVYRVSFPRTDVAVKVEGRTMHPFLGLTSWAAFTPHSNNELMVMGDLVLFEDEVNPAMSAALDNGLEVTALHNHFFFDSPRVMFMHIGGTGTAERLATAVRRALDKVKEIRAANAQPAGKFPGAAVPDTNSITAAALDSILGVKGQVNAGMYKVAIGRKAAMHGRSVGNQMGVNTWAAFAGTDAAAFVDGDFAMLESELQPVLKALRKAGIHIVAIHNHMTHEEPQYVFLHYWGKGPAAALAKGLKSALLLMGPELAQRITLDSAKAGAVPPDWTVAMTHAGGAPKWEIVNDPSAPSKPNVLAQTSTDNTSGRFPLAIYGKASFTNGALSVQFKAVSGERDQAAGLVWRYKDPDNYYIVRGNALEDNVVLYKVESGKRISLEPKGTPPRTYGVKHKVPKQAWSTLKVAFDGPRFEVFFDGERIMEVEDTTFSGAGQVGLWTKADSVTYFDDVLIEKKN